MTTQTTMITYTGRLIDVARMTADDVDLRDVGYSLSRLPRYGGHIPLHGRDHYSVAEHSILLAEMVPKKYSIYALFHDAAEAYIGDIIAPVRACISGLDEIEDRVHAAICDHANIDIEIPQCVLDADRRIREHELATLFPRNARIVPDDYSPRDYPTICRWSPDQAYRMWFRAVSDAFLDRI